MATPSRFDLVAPAGPPPLRAADAALRGRLRVGGGGARWCGVCCSPWTRGMKMMWQCLAMATSPRLGMAGGGDHTGANKRKREAAGRPKAPSKGGGDATKGKKRRSEQPVTAKDKRVAAKEMSDSRKMKRKPNYNLEKLCVPGED